MRPGLWAQYQLVVFPLWHEVWKVYQIMALQLWAQMFVFHLNALTELIILTTALSLPCSLKLRSFNMLVRSVKDAKSSSHWLSFSWLYSACLYTRKNSLIFGQSSWNLCRNFPQLSHLTSVCSNNSVWSQSDYSQCTRNRRLWRDLAWIEPAIFVATSIISFMLSIFVHNAC